MMTHIVDMCLSTEFEGRLQSLHDLDDAFSWLETTVTVNIR